MTGTAPPRWQTLAVIVVSTALHLTTFAVGRQRTNADSQSYLDLGQQLLTRGTFTAPDRVAYAVPPGSFPMGPEAPETIRTPIYPLVLALVFLLGGSIGTVVFLQHTMMIALAAGIHRFIASTVSHTAGFVSGLLFGSFPPMLIVSNQVTTEPLTAILVAVALALLLVGMRRQSPVFLALSGLMMGAAILTRPIVLYLPLPLFVVVLARRRSISLGLTFAVAAASLPGGWALRNYYRTGVVLVSSIEGENLLVYRTAGTLIVAEKKPADALFALQQQMGFYQRALRLRIPLIQQALATSTASNHAQRSRAYARLGLRTIAAHPVAYLELATSAVIAMYVDNLACFAADRGSDLVSARIRWIPVSLAMILCAIVGFRALFRVDRDLAWVILVALVYFTIVSAGPEVELRFTVPFLPMYAAAIGIGAVTLGRAIRKRAAAAVPRAGAE